MTAAETLDGRPPIPGEVRWESRERTVAAYFAEHPSGDPLGDFCGDGMLRFMCNLYSVTTSKAAIRQLTQYTRDMVGNLPRIPAVFPDSTALVVRTAPMASASW
jgi:hypothetical protein